MPTSNFLETTRRLLQKKNKQTNKSQSPPMSATRVVSQHFPCPLDFQHQNQIPAHTLKLNGWCHGSLEMKKEVPPHHVGESNGIYHTVLSKDIFLTNSFFSLTSVYILDLLSHGCNFQNFHSLRYLSFWCFRQSSGGRISVQPPVTHQ